MDTTTNNTASALNLSTLPSLAWPTWGDADTDTLPASHFWIAGEAIPADALSDQLASLGTGAWPIMAGRTGPADGLIDFRPVGWLTLHPDGTIEHEPAD